MEKLDITILGGDKRSLFCAQKLLLLGHNVSLSGFENLQGFCGLPIEESDAAIEKSDFIILPVMPIKGEREIVATFSNEPIILSDRLALSLNKKTVFCGSKKKLLRANQRLFEKNVFDYLSREDFSIANAVLTAEGAIAVAVNKYEGSLFGSRCLVCGYGRIGKILSAYLHYMGAKVTVCARKQSDLAYIRAFGYNASETSELKSFCDYDIIFNTVPSLIFDEALLEKLPPEILIIDLASLPGGVDFSAAKSLDIDVIHALSLPGKTAPKSAGEIIADVVLEMVREIKTGKL